MTKRVFSLNVNPGEPTDGTGKVCIHLFVPDATGPFVERHVLHMNAERKVEARPTRGRLACDRKRLVAPVTRKGVTIVTPRTDDPRAVTCPRCIASAEYAELMSKLEPQPQSK